MIGGTMLSLNKSLFRQVLCDLVQRLTGVSDNVFARYTGREWLTPQGITSYPSEAGKLSCCAANTQWRSVQSAKDVCKPSGGIARPARLPDSQVSECDTTDLRLRLEALFSEYQSQAESRDVIFTLFGEARVAAPPALVDTLLVALLDNGLNFAEEFVQFRLSARGLQMLNPVSGSGAGQDLDGHGLEVARRICEGCGWQLTHAYRKQVFVVDICFTAPSF